MVIVLSKLDVWECVRRGKTKDQPERFQAGAYHSLFIDFNFNGLSAPIDSF